MNCEFCHVHQIYQNTCAAGDQKSLKKVFECLCFLDVGNKIQSNRVKYCIDKQWNWFSQKEPYHLPCRVSWCLQWACPGLIYRLEIEIKLALACSLTTDTNQQPHLHTLQGLMYRSDILTRFSANAVLVVGDLASANFLASFWSVLAASVYATNLRQHSPNNILFQTRNTLKKCAEWWTWIEI